MDALLVFALPRRFMTTAPDLPALTRVQSLAEQAYQAIREGIATGTFAAGERVTERGLAARLGVSPTPVREALRRLEQEGLIERVSARILRVIEHSPEALRELMYIGATLRAAEARFAAAKITDDALRRMTVLLERIADEDNDLADDERLRLAGEFDAEIERAAANPALRGLIESVSVIGRERRTRSVQALRRHTDIARLHVDGHREILGALRRRDADAVEDAFRRHAVAGIDLLLRDLG
jgi:DNA-binding GntR family transcriptional regulator